MSNSDYSSDNVVLTASMKTINKKILVTGGAGFIGSALVKKLSESGITVYIIDKLTYAANPEFLKDFPNHRLDIADICDQERVKEAVFTFQPDIIFHLAAESHVDRSIKSPEAFIDTNVKGTLVLLNTCLRYYKTLSEDARQIFRFVHVSTDEVFGSLGKEGVFTEQSCVEPNSPYSASKAASDHLARAWYKTYGLPVCITNCSNNYGPRQNAEKLIPTVIRNALLSNLIPIYGNGSNVRDWLYVNDHIEALMLVAQLGQPGERYCIGGDNEINNLAIAERICSILDALKPKENGQSYAAQLSFVKDRLGHDFRYAIDATKIWNEFGWKPRHNFEEGLKETIQWYLDNPGRLKV